MAYVIIAARSRERDQVLIKRAFKPVNQRLYLFPEIYRKILISSKFFQIDRKKRDQSKTD
jgi:hypothetical protein